MIFEIIELIIDQYSFPLMLIILGLLAIACYRYCIQESKKPKKSRYPDFESDLRQP
jgi:hypothetical protein